MNTLMDRNLAMLMDYYELTMANGYMENGYQDTIAYFDVFFRKVPDNGGFAIFAGLEQVIEYLSNLHFDEQDIKYVRSQNIFSEGFIDYLANFKFSCDVWSVEEGTPIFPNEPIMTIRGPILQTQLIETLILLTVNHQSLIATKANRICRASSGKGVMEFGARRAHGYDASIFGARAAYIGGCSGTSCVMADKLFGIPALGTMAHSWVQLFPTELDAFRAYAKVYPDDCTLLVDTYNTIGSGVPNAITVFKELRNANFEPKGVRIDSGDIAYLSKKIRKMLDAEGFENVKIIASNSLDEYIIMDLLRQDAKIDVFGVGERLVTSKSESVFGGVYKLAAVEVDGEIIPKIKVSENAIKITNPGFKNCYRLYSNDDGKAIADLITMYDEVIDGNSDYVLFDPIHPYLKKKITNFRVEELRRKIFDKGKCVYKSPSVSEIRSKCLANIDSLWDELKRFENPHKYFVDLSQKLYQTKINYLENFL